MTLVSNIQAALYITYRIGKTKQVMVVLEDDVG